MSDESAAAHRALLRTMHLKAILSDLQMVADGAPLGLNTLVDRWMTHRPYLTRAHLLAARRQCALTYHPDRGGSSKMMTLANEAIDAALARLDTEAEIDMKEIA